MGASCDPREWRDGGRSVLGRVEGQWQQLIMRLSTATTVNIVAASAAATAQQQQRASKLGTVLVDASWRRRSDSVTDVTRGRLGADCASKERQKWCRNPYFRTCLPIFFSACGAL